MSEMRKSLWFVAAALVLGLLAILTSPRRATPDAFSDIGEPFFPDFDNPNEARTLEVVEFDEETAEARPFKVTFEDGRWAIPSHHGYPADGKDRLAKTAAGVIGITRDDFRTDNVADHAACGVLDPLDAVATSLTGRGKRVTLRGKSDQILADFIVGGQPEGREGYRFVRIPDRKRVYVAKMDIDISTRFEDWIEKDLLQVDRGSIERIVLKDYSIDERTGRVDEKDLITLRKKDADWAADKMRADQKVDTTTINDMLGALDDLSIVGVRPKPEGLSESLKRVEGNALMITQGDLLSLQSKGYFFSRDGSLLSNEGELQVFTKDGIEYTLRFGEIVYGRGEAVTAGTGETAEEDGPGENRYLFITARFDPGSLPEPARPASTAFRDKAESEWTDEDRRNKDLHDAHEKWSAAIEKGRELDRSLNARFAGWYYVIPSESFEKMDVTRADLVVKKES